MYFASRFSISRASTAGVVPVAGTSWTSGIARRPSGRTATVTDSSGLRQTKILSTSPGPIWYGGACDIAVGGAGGRVETHAVRRQPSATAPTRALLPVTPTSSVAPNSRPNERLTTPELCRSLFATGGEFRFYIPKGRSGKYVNIP